MLKITERAMETAMHCVPLVELIRKEEPQS